MTSSRQYSNKSESSNYTANGDRLEASLSYHCLLLFVRHVEFLGGLPLFPGFCCRFSAARSLLPVLVACNSPFHVQFFSHLHYNEIQRVCEAISGSNYKIARNCLTYMSDYIEMQMRKVNREKGYCMLQSRKLTLEDNHSFRHNRKNSLSHGNQAD